MQALALVGGIGLSGVVTVGAFFMYFVLIFFVGLALYYFTGPDRTGGKILESLMRLGGRIYAHIWMLLMSLTALVGLSLFVKAVLGALFQDFVYMAPRFGQTDAIATMRQNDLQTGLVLFVLALIIYLVHWGFAYLIETAEERKGTVLTKLVNTTGLFLTSLVFFGMLMVFAFDLIGGVKAGGSLAWTLGALPFWVFYALKTVWTVKNEVA